MLKSLEEDKKLQKYQYIGLLGNGAYGQVYKAICTCGYLAGKQVAVKEVQDSRLITQEDK